MYKFCGSIFFILLDMYFGVELPDFIMSHLRHCQTVSQISYPISHYHQQNVSIPISPHPHQPSLFTQLLSQCLLAPAQLPPALQQGLSSPFLAQAGQLLPPASSLNHLSSLLSTPTPLLTLSFPAPSIRGTVWADLYGDWQCLASHTQALVCFLSIPSLGLYFYLPRCLC